MFQHRLLTYTLSPWKIFGREVRPNREIILALDTRFSLRILKSIN